MNEGIITCRHTRLNYKGMERDLEFEKKLRILCEEAMRGMPKNFPLEFKLHYMTFVFAHMLDECVVMLDKKIN